MKLSKSTKILGIPLLWFIITLIIITSVTAAAMYHITIPGEVVVVETPSGNYEIKVYEDEACTTPLTFIDFGELQSGEQNTFYFYVKNTGDLSITSIWVKVESDVYSTDSRMGPSALALGESMRVHAFMIATDVTPGAYPVTITITAHA